MQVASSGVFINSVDRKPSSITIVQVASSGVFINIVDKKPFLYAITCLCCPYFESYSYFVLKLHLRSNCIKQIESKSVDIGLAAFVLIIYQHSMCITFESFSIK